MLTDPTPHPRHAPPSLRQAYAEFVEQRIEEFKEQLSRPDLLQLADEAVRELDEQTGQLVLTEVLVHDHVDRLIKKRLRLPGFRRWREKHLHLRAAQRTPTHWGLPSDSPLVRLGECLEETDLAIVVGSNSTAAAMFLAAHDAHVMLIDQDLAQIEAAETMAASESLSTRFEALVIHLGHWFPDHIQPALVVLDPTTLGRLDTPVRLNLVETLKERTVNGGVHVTAAGEGGGSVVPIAPDALQTLYGGWTTQRASRGGRTRWFTARKP